MQTVAISKCIETSSLQFGIRMHKPRFFDFIAIGFFFGIVTCCTSVGKRAETIDPPAVALQSLVENEIGKSHSPEEICTEELPDNWWTLFRDPQLSDLIESSFERNPTFHAGAVTVLKARAIAGQVGSSLYPQIFFGADVSRQKLSETGIIPFNENTSGISAAQKGSAGAVSSIPGVLPGAGLATPVKAGIDGIPVYFTQYETEVTLNYEIDIWGKNRKRLQAAIGDYQARQADLAFIRLQLGTSIASTYFRLQVNYRREEIARALVKNREKKRRLIRARADKNISSLPEILAVESDLTDMRQQLLLLESDIATDIYALKAYIAGDFLEEITDIRIETLPLPKILLPANLPLHLISRRPDIAAQLLLIASAEKRIEIARTGFYPDFNLFALFGFQTLHLSKLFEKKSIYFNVDPAVTLPIFDGGRLLSDLRETEADYDSVVFRYNQLVLDAAQEVLTETSVLRNAVARLEEFIYLAEVKRKISELSELRVKNHLDSDIAFSDREKEFLVAQDQELSARNDLLQSIVSLIKALGGGYDPCNEGEL